MAKRLTVLHLPTAAKPWVVGGREAGAGAGSACLPVRGGKAL